MHPLVSVFAFDAFNLNIILYTLVDSTRKVYESTNGSTTCPGPASPHLVGHPVYYTSEQLLF